MLVLIHSRSLHCCIKCGEEFIEQASHCARKVLLVLKKGHHSINKEETEVREKEKKKKD